MIPYRTVDLARVATVRVEEASPTVLHRRTLPVLTLDDDTRVRVTSLIAPRVFRTQQRFVEKVLSSKEVAAHSAT